MGFDTAAKMKEHKKVAAPKTSFLDTLPQAAILLPSAPTSGGPVAAFEEWCGYTLTAAPVSTRNGW